MAVSSYDKQNLSSDQQSQINAVTTAAQNGTMSWADAHNAAEAIRASAGYSGGQYGNDYSAIETTPSTTDLSGYLSDLYAAQTKAKLASLQSAYEQNKATLESQGSQIAPTYQTQKNQAAAQSDLSKQQFNEVAAANGLNSGTAGQAALASNIALQGNLNTLSKEQANAESENSLALANLATEYQNAITEAQASGDSSLASALYDEYVRQAEAETTAAQNAQAQSNWEKEYEESLKENQQSVDSESKQYAYNTAMAMIESGVMPSTSLLSSAGISYSDALSMVNAVKAQAAATTTSAKSSSSSSSSSSKKSSSSGSSSSTSSTSSAYNNGSLTASQVKEIQKYYGVTADGLWGSNSSKAAGGLTADEAWGFYTKYKSTGNYQTVAETLAGMKKSGKSTSDILDAIREAYNNGLLTLGDYSSLYNQYRG